MVAGSKKATISAASPAAKAPHVKARSNEIFGRMVEEVMLDELVVRYCDQNDDGIASMAEKKSGSALMISWRRRVNAVASPASRAPLAENIKVPLSEVGEY